ncbi:uncharacterized protein LOC131285191 [Anopheles ziemanni]|uniref:uncharacterized protein LOC131264629 n=1 Tax=Anopheles coustani TaxID=139045 RepID=UPI00265908DF|nr:uncharacterized protein LOC131264629 [Anopheles coustani]XP_058170036.1 uncharacterized protein LOC131285191 [Anopheles ziemanni]
MVDSLVETLFEAITVGDEEQVELCLKSATIAIVLEFEAIYGESPLHLCVKLGGVSHLGLVRRLLASGLVDFDQRDNEGQTVLEYAYRNGDQELTKQLIGVEMEGLDDVTACYKMLKHDSLDLFKLFLSMKNMSEVETFKNIASAFVKLNVKNFVLSEELRHFAQWKLSDYAYRNLSGNWPGVKDPTEWKDHIDIIDDCWRVISEKYDTRLYDDVDDQLLHRLHIIHNCLYFLKHKQFLNHLPMSEIVFCVAMFISIFKNSTQFNEYRLLVNKRLVMDFVRMVHRQLKLAKNHLEMAEKELTTIMQEAQRLNANAKDRLIEEMLEKLKASNFPNKAHWVAETTKKINYADEPNKDVLIKDMKKKLKSSNKMYLGKAIQAIEEGNKRHFIEEIRKRSLHVTHPQNVVNRLMAGKGKTIGTIVAETVGEACFDLKHLLRGKGRRIIRKIKTCYTKMKQIYSLHKALHYCKELNLDNELEDSAIIDSVNSVSCILRMTQVFGEAIKNTQSSPNLPGKAKPAVGGMLTQLFPLINISLRETISHSVSFKRILVDEVCHRQVCKTTRQHLRTVYISFLLLYVVALIDARQSFYGLMRRCGSYEALRSLLLYADDTEEMEKQHFSFFETIKKYFDDAQTLFTELQDSLVGKSLEFIYLHKKMERKIAIVMDLEKFFIESSLVTHTEIRRACFVGDDLAGTQRLLDWKLSMSWGNKFFSSIHSEWEKEQIHTYQLDWMDPRLLKFNPAVLAGLLKTIAVSMDCAEQFDYLWHTRKLIQELGLARSFDENATQELNQRLKPYYDNIFFVESKWRIVKTFCKSRKIEMNEMLVHELTNSDQAKLQTLFDDRREKLRTILEKHDMNTVENLASCGRNLPPSAEASLEYLQLEICEMLVAVGYFGDNFQYLKHRMPMIQGRNYRNYLAHDSLSYNLLTDSWTEKTVINAYVFAYTELHLFGKREMKTEVMEMSYPTVQDTHRWTEEQSQMKSAFQTEDLNQIVAAIKNGGEIRSVFCCSPNQKKISPQFRNLTVLVDSCNVNPLIARYLNTYFHGFSEVCEDPVHQLKSALLMCNYQAAFDRTIGRGPARDTLIRHELFDWPELMPRVRKTDLFIHLIAAFNRQRILKALIEHGNQRGVQEILPFFEDFRDPTQLGPLRDALVYNMRSIAELLLARTTAPHGTAVELLLIIIHWNDMFPTIVLKSEMCSEKLELLLKTAAQSRNYTASVFLLENALFKQYIPGAFRNSCIHAARMGETSLLRHLLESHSTTSQVLAEIVYHAAVRKQWKCVSLLLDRDAPVDIEFLGKNYEQGNTLIILVKFGLWRLIDRVRSIHCRMYGDNITHPFSIAISYGMMSGGMVRTLRRLGFDWIDESVILHAAIIRRDSVTLAIIWREIDVIIQSNHLEIEDSHFAFAIKVLTTWQTIGFVEESTTLETSLMYAIHYMDKDMIKELLDRAKSMRHLEGIGILNSIVFKTSTSIVCFGKRSENRICNVQKSCKDMITRLKSTVVLDMGWQEFTIDLGVPVEFYVLSANKEKIDLSQQTTDVDMRKSGSMLNRLNDFMMVSNALFAEASVFAAHFKLSEGTSVYFWQVEDISCVYNILPLESEIDLSSTVNYRNFLGETPLHKCFPNDELNIVKMLVEAGANPLFADQSGMAAIHISLWNSKDFAVARYLVEVCQDRELRNEHGLSLVDLEDGNLKNRLIHIAVMTGRQDIVERLVQLKVDASMKNSIGLTPIQTALKVTLPNKSHMIKLLLDYDSSSIDAMDPMGDTLLFSAVKYHSIEVLQEILRHDPDITLSPEGCTALCLALMLKKSESSKCLLRYAVEKGIRGITSIDEEDIVVLSLICNDYSLSKSLFEYELEHSLEEINVNDLPRIVAILNTNVLKASNVPMWQYVLTEKIAMESGLVEALFEAITVGDEEQVELCLKSATIAIVLEFEAIYGESPLHLCVKLGGVSHLGLVRRLLASGLVDFDQRDNEGQTVLEYAYQNGDQELTKQLIGVEMEGLDDVTACYKMLKHDSLDLFKLFLSMKNMSEDETFKNIASAFVKLNVKNFVLSEELRHFAQWKLSDYAYRNLSGNWRGVKDPTEWKDHIDIIDDCWRVISEKYDTRLYDDVDDQLLHRLHIIHNCLYFLKHKQFLNHLPMSEIVFCVAMFISIFKNSTQFNEYRLLVNKRLVMDFVRMVHRQLKLAKNHLEMAEKELTTIMQEAQRLNANAKDRLIEEMLEKLKASNFPNKAHWVAETTKKINDAEGLNKDVLIKDMMKKLKSSNKMYLGKAIQAIEEGNKRHFIEEIRKRSLHVTHPQNVVNRLMAGKGKTIDARQSFYGLMRRCGSYEALRSLLLYADDTEEMEKQHFSFFETIKKYFDDAQTLFTELQDSLPKDNGDGLAA